MSWWLPHFKISDIYRKVMCQLIDKHYPYLTVLILVFGLLLVIIWWNSKNKPLILLDVFTLVIVELRVHKPHPKKKPSKKYIGGKHSQEF